MNSVTSIYSPEAARDDRTASIEAYYLKDWQGYDMPPHRHNSMEIMYVMAGRCAIPTQDNELTLKKNEFILLDAGVPHGLRVLPDAVCRIMNIEFTLNKKSEALSLRAASGRHPALKRFLAETRPYLVFVDSEDVHGVLRRLINCLDDAHDGQLLEIELLAAELFMAIARLFDEGGSVQHVSQTYVRRAMQYMNQNYYRDIGIKDVCSHVGLAEGYLSRVFKTGSGETVNGYLAMIRIRKAKMLLGKTELPIIEISGYVGIPSRQYFNQFFKKHTGLTPGEYRKLCGRDSAANPGCL
jgi:AraC family transcriptional regulator, melibiose operon regulatory protein